MRRPRRDRTLVAVLAVLAVALVGCGSSGGDDASTTTTAGSDEAEQTTTTEDRFAPVGEVDDPAERTDTSEADYVAALAADLASGETLEGDLVVTRDQADCIAPRWVTAITVDALHEAGLDAEDMDDFDVSALDLDEPTARTMVEAFGACDVALGPLVAELVTLDLSPFQQRCARDEVDEDLVEEMLVAAFANDEAGADAAYDDVLAQIDAACAPEGG